MSLGFLVRRVIVFFLVMWAAMTLTFFLPKLAPGRDPIQDRMAMLAATGGANTANIADMVKAYQANFGLDQPLYVQYFRYLGNIVRLDFNYSLAQYPAKVIDLITISLPWTVGLLTMTTLISFGLGSLLGGLLAWPKAPRWLGYLIPPLVTLSAIPYFLLGIIFVYIFAFVLKVFPLGGGSAFGVMPTVSVEYYADILYHSLLPAASIVAAALGFWALAMRGMMVTTMGEDYMVLAEAKGLPARRIFFWYGMRNALLPQTTSLALSLGHLVSGALLVEIIFRYPGMGTLLFRAVTGFDYFTIYGVVYFIIVGICLATLLLDLVYPMLDPRIRYQRA
jgi:peptide/nickel transport system permease protein